MICFTWWGLTQYAARAIEAFSKVSPEKVEIIATRPSTPVKGLEDVLTCPIHWVEEGDENALSLLSEIPRVLFVSNWSLTVWRPIEKAVRAKHGVVVAMVDNNYQFTIKHLLSAIRFRLFQRHRFKAMFVPGESGVKLARLYGFDCSRVFKGLYGGDNRLFHDGLPLVKRGKRLIYVGQMIERKNVRRMCEAFIQVASRHSDWSLEMYGRGPLSDQLPTHSQIHVHDFVQATELAKLYREARVFILPSLEEHWGVVVHEAALSGCYLLLSDRIGAADDFATPQNAGRFNPFSVSDIARAMDRSMSLTDGEYANAQTVSLQLASQFGPHRFAESGMSLMR